MPRTAYCRLMELVDQHQDRVELALDLMFLPDLHPSAPPELEILFSDRGPHVYGVAFLEPENPVGAALWVAWNQELAERMQTQPVPLLEGLHARLDASPHAEHAAWMRSELALLAPAGRPRGLPVSTSDGLGARVPMDSYDPTEIRILGGAEAAALGSSLYGRGRFGSALVVLREGLTHSHTVDFVAIHTVLAKVLRALGRTAHAQRCEEWVHQGADRRGTQKTYGMNSQGTFLV